MAKLMTDYPVERNTLLFVMSEDCKPKGWRVDLLVEKLSSKVEEKVLLCISCNGLLRDACICNGALMCQVCIPADTVTVVQPVVMNREIVNEKMIYCPLKCRGCGWSETMSAAVNHLEDCVYLPEMCPLGCVSLERENKGEVVRMERRHIPEHVRDSCPLREIVCEFCEGKVKASEMNPHLEECEEFPLHCPKGCSIEVKRKDIPIHLDNHCPLQKVLCPYWDHGCREEMERRQTDAHEREFFHIHFKLSLTKMEHNQNESTQVTQRIQHNLDNANEKIAVQELHFTESLKLSRAELNAATERIAILEEQNYDKDLQIASLITYLVPQLPSGKLIWKVEGVKLKIRNKERSYSDPFYVGLYKYQGSIHWDCNNTRKVVVLIAIHIMKGDFDAKIHWPIRYKHTIVLINQINIEDNLVKFNEISKELLEKYPECFNRPTGIRNDGFGSTSFTSTTEIFEEKYCKQDSITLHISVEVLPPL